MTTYPKVVVYIAPMSLSNPFAATHLSIPTIVAFGLSFGFVPYFYCQHLMYNGKVYLEPRAENQPVRL